MKRASRLVGKEEMLKAVARGTAKDPQTMVPFVQWTARVELAACFRIFAVQGWTELVCNHITLRLPGPANPAGFTVHADEGPRLARDIGDRRAVILRNHGLLSWRDTVPRAFAILWTLNRACKIQLASMSMGPVIEIDQELKRKCTRDSLQCRKKFGSGQDVFDALTRMVDRSDTTYRS